MSRWIDGLADQRRKVGVGEPAARIQARLDLAVARGLLPDLLAIEERDEVNQAYDHYLQLVDLTAKRSGGTPARKGQRRKACSGRDILRVGRFAPPPSRRRWQWSLHNAPPYRSYLLNRIEPVPSRR